MAQTYQTTNLNQETVAFKANTSNVMNIMVNSLYENTHTIVLRELISNSSDAITKAVRQNLFDLTETAEEKIGKKSVFDLSTSSKSKPWINLWYEKEEKQFYIEDNGVGMTREDLTDRIGDIATSGTRQFGMEDQESKEDLIGQFGVGFYSSFAIADSVTIYTKTNDSDKVLVWRYNKNDPGNFTIKEDPDLSLISSNHGTKIVLNINEKSEKLYFDDRKVEEMIVNRSSFVQYPVNYLYKSDEKKEGEWKTLSSKAIWLMEDRELTEKDYNDFFVKHVKWNRDNDFRARPFAYKKFNIESTLGYSLRGFIALPKNISFNYGEQAYKGCIRTFSKGVHITDNNDNLIPDHLKFVIGFIDSTDFDLNISRNNIQTINKEHIKSMRKDIIKLVFNMIKDMKSESDSLLTRELSGEALTESEITNKNKYDSFYKKYHKHLKMSFHDEMSGKDGKRESSRIKGALNLFGLFKFNTSKDRFITVNEYVQDMKKDQKCIYYLSGFKQSEAMKSPFITKLLKHDYEVLFLEDVVDDYLKNFLVEFKNGKLVDCKDNDKSREPDMKDLDTKIFIDTERDDLHLTFDEDHLLNKEEQNTLCQKLMELYEKNNIFKFFEIRCDDKVGNISGIIKNHVHLSAQMEKQVNNQAIGERQHQLAPVFNRKDFLINPSDKLIKKLYDMLNVDDDNIIYDNDVVELCKYIRELALLTGGLDLEKPLQFALQSHQFVLKSMDL